MRFTKSRSFNWLVLFCFYFQTLWPTVVFASDTEVMRPVSSSRFFYSPSLPETMFLDLNVTIDEKAEAFGDVHKKPALRIPYAETLDVIQGLVDASLSITKLYPGLKVSEDGLRWNHYGYSFFLENKGGLRIKKQAGAKYIAPILRVHNVHGSVSMEEEFNLCHLLVKGQEIFFKGTQGSIENLSLWATEQGESVFIEPTTSLIIKNVSIHQGALANHGDVSVSKGGLFDGGESPVVNRGSLKMGDQSTLRAKKIDNQRVQDKSSDPLVVGQLSGEGRVTFDVGLFDNLGEVKINIIQGHIDQLINPGHFEAIKEFKDFTVERLFNDGCFKGNGLLKVSGINRGFINGRDLTLFFLDEFLNRGLITVSTNLSTEGKGAFLQEGKLDLPHAYFNNSQFINRSSFDLSHSTFVFGKDVLVWSNDETAAIFLKNLTFDKAQKEGKEFINEGSVRVKEFKNRRLFTNSGSFHFGQWQQEGVRFINEQEGSVEVDDEAIFDTDLIDNQGSITLKGKSKGRIAIIKTTGEWFFKGSSQLTGSKLLIGSKGKLRAYDLFDWSGETVNNEGRLLLEDNRIQATRQVINSNLFRWTHNSFRTWHFLNLGWAEVTEHLDSALPSFAIADDKSTTFKNSTVENRGILKMSPTAYNPRMDIKKEEKITHWINTSGMEAKGQSFSAESFQNKGELVTRGPITGTINHFENSGKLTTHDTFSVTGQTFVSTDKSFVESHSAFDVNVTNPLQMRGTWNAHQQFSLAAPRIETYGTVVNSTGKSQMNTSSLINKGGKILLGVMSYEGQDIANDQGRIQIGKIDRKSQIPLNIINKRSADEVTRDETRKTKFHLKGGAKLDISNTASLILDEGRYEITSIDNTKGYLEATSVSFDGYNGSDLFLDGILLIEKLYGTKSLREISISGRTTIFGGEFKAQRLHIFSSSQIGLGGGESDFGEIFNQGIIVASPWMKVTTRNLDNGRGTIESDLPVKIQWYHDSEYFEKDVTSTPTILVQLKKGQDSGENLRLGLLKTKRDLHLHLSPLFDLAKALYRFGENWQCEGTLYLKGGVFRPSSDTSLSRKIQLEVSDYENDRYALAFQSLKLIANKFRHGKSNGEMASLEICSANSTGDHVLEITVDGDLDTRYGHIYGSVPTILKSKTGDVLVGTARIKPNQPVCNTYTSGTVILL